MPTEYDISKITIEELAGMSFLERYHLITETTSVNNLIQVALNMQELVLQANLPSAGALSNDPEIEEKLFAALRMNRDPSPIEAELMFRTIEAYLRIQISKIEMCTDEQQLMEITNAFIATLTGYNSAAPVIFHKNTEQQDFKKTKTSDLALHQNSNIILNYLRLRASLRSLTITSAKSGKAVHVSLFRLFKTTR